MFVCVCDASVWLLSENLWGDIPHLFSLIIKIDRQVVFVSSTNNEVWAVIMGLVFFSIF